MVLKPVSVQLPPRPAPDTPRPCRRKKGGRMIMRPGQQLLLPANPLFIWGSLLAGAAFNMLPLGRTPWLPDLLILVLVFWSVHQPLRVGVGVAFFFGLCMDVHQTALLGQHALAYTLLSFVAITIHRRLLWFSVPSQALQVLPLFVAAHGVADRPHGQRRRCSRAGRCCWRRAGSRAVARGQHLLLAPQRRAPDPDENRPL
jgi:rod shape-determining protein MreD